MLLSVVGNGMEGGIMGNMEQVASQAKFFAAGQKQKKASQAKAKKESLDSVYKSFGLIKVKGAVSGKTYWE